MGDNPLEMIENVGLNLMTGGLYSIGKAALSDDPLHNLMAQGLDLGLASTFNQSIVDTFGTEAGMAFNAAGGALGAAGLMGAFSSLPGFAPGGGVAATAIPGSSGLTGAAALTEGGPIVATGTPTPLAPGVMSSTTGADMAGATLTGPVGAEAVTPSLSTPVAPGSGVSSAPINVSDLTPKDYGSLTQSIDNIKQGADVTKEVATWSPEMKAALTMGGTLAAGQMLTGGMGGLFTGMSAQKQLELQQLINSQNQNQRQYLNANNQYAPSLTFKKPVSQPVGVLATPK